MYLKFLVIYLIDILCAFYINIYDYNYKNIFWDFETISNVYRYMYIYVYVCNVST